MHSGAVILALDFNMIYNLTKIKIQQKTMDSNNKVPTIKYAPLFKQEIKMYVAEQSWALYRSM